jgi:lysyl-tRNA synthetase class 2
MLYWQTAMEIELFAKRSSFIQAIKCFFYARNYTEVETPLLSPCLIPESTLEVFATEFLIPDKTPLPLYLIPSPELWMKRLVAQERKSIFQICKCFRNGESLSNIHNPEFTMLEWYTIHADYHDSLKHTEELFSFLCGSLFITSPIHFNGQEINLNPPFLKVSMDQTFKEVLGLRIGELNGERDLQEICKKQGVPVSADDSWEQLFNKLFLTFIEPELPKAKPFFLYDYPHRIPTTAKKIKGTPFAERWELYIGGVEIANCFSEETDPACLRSFYENEVVKKKHSLVNHAVDWQLLDCFSHFPPCSGVALGIDRLFMILYNKTHIKGVVFFTVHDIIT